MELAAGTFDNLLESIQGKAMAELPLCAYGWQMLEGLVYLHKTLHVLHRDLKLNNIFLQRETGRLMVNLMSKQGSFSPIMQAQIAYFGLATTIYGEAKAHFKGSALASLYHYAPELCTEGVRYWSAVIYGLTCLFSRSRTLRQPISGPSAVSCIKQRRAHPLSPTAQSPALLWKAAMIGPKDQKKREGENNKTHSAKLSSRLQDFLARAFKVDRRKRANAFDPIGERRQEGGRSLMELVREHPWFDLCRKYMKRTGISRVVGRHFLGPRLK